MGEYSVVFAGEIVPGFDLAGVRRAASNGLRANAAQLDALFSGQPVVMKRGLTLVQGKHYLAVLNKTGMRANLMPPPPEMPVARYRIVFRGALVSGFEPAQVSRLAASALRFNADQLQQLFSGKRAILKRGLDRSTGERFVAELARIGMQAALEQESPPTLPAVPSVAAMATTPAPAQVMAQHMETLVVGGDALARHLAEMPPPPSPPTTVPDRLQAKYMATLVVGQEAYAQQLEARTDLTAVAAKPVVSAPPETSVATRFIRCPACGSKQPMRQQCVACGKVLAPAEPVAPVTVMPAPQDLNLPPEPTGADDDPDAAAPDAQRRAAWLIGGLLFVLCVAIAGFVWLY